MHHFVKGNARRLQGGDVRIPLETGCAADQGRRAVVELRPGARTVGRCFSANLRSDGRRSTVRRHRPDLGQEHHRREQDTDPLGVVFEVRPESRGFLAHSQLLISRVRD